MEAGDSDGCESIVMHSYPQFVLNSFTNKASPPMGVQIQPDKTSNQTEPMVHSMFTWLIDIFPFL